MKYYLKSSIVAVFGLLFALQSNAQMRYTSNSIGLQFGTTSPYTDIRSHQYFRTLNTSGKSEFQPYIGLNALHMFSHVLGIYADANFGIVQGVMSDRDKRGSGYDYLTEDYALYQRLGFHYQIYSKTTFADASLNMYINFSNLGWFTKLANNKNAPMRKWGIYGYAGVGLVTYHAEVHSLGASDEAKLQAKDIYYLHGIMTNSTGLFKVTDLVFPTALGFKYHLSNAIDLGIEASLRFTSTDKFDAVVDNAPRTYGANFQGTSTPSGGSTLATSRYQGYAYDKYAFLGFKVSYKLGDCKPGNQNIEWHDPQEAMMKSMDAEMGKLKSLFNDSDKDGVSDAFDKEPNTPAGVRVDGAGQALDVDGDGVPDYKDDEPFSPKGASVNETGVAVDSDNDGVPDVKDLEPNSKSGALVNFRGITIGQRDAAPVAAKEDKPLFIFPSIYFDLSSNEIRPQYADVLSDAARSLIKYPDIKIDIFGNCDVRGNDALNNDLGRRRAEAVANYLKKNFNISADRIKIVETLGKQHPISNQHRPNRRVDILLAQ